MSLKNPRVYGSRPCRERAATEVVDKPASPWNEAHRIGKCARCGRWGVLTKAGDLRPHMDYEADKSATPVQPTKEDHQ